jgi:hypothetical protein
LASPTPLTAASWVRADGASAALGPVLFTISYKFWYSQLKHYKEQRNLATRRSAIQPAAL